MGLRTFLCAARIFCLSKANFGWVGRAPTWTAAHKLFTATFVASGPVVSGTRAPGFRPSFTEETFTWTSVGLLAWWAPWLKPRFSARCPGTGLDVCRRGPLTSGSLVAAGCALLPGTGGTTLRRLSSCSALGAFPLRLLWARRNMRCVRLGGRGSPSSGRLASNMSCATLMSDGIDSVSCSGTTPVSGLTAALRQPRYRWVLLFPPLIGP